jgi:hypothetical protein
LIAFDANHGHRDICPYHYRLANPPGKYQHL